MAMLSECAGKVDCPRLAARLDGSFRTCSERVDDRVLIFLFLLIGEWDGCNRVAPQPSAYSANGALHLPVSQIRPSRRSVPPVGSFDLLSSLSVSGHARRTSDGSSRVTRSPALRGATGAVACSRAPVVQPALCLSSSFDMVVTSLALPLLLLSVCLLLAPLFSAKMEKIHELGVDLNSPTSESLPLLISLPLHVLLTLRNEIFTEASSLGLTCEGDVPVSRRDSRLKPLNTKLAEDIISLLICIKNESPVVRTLLKNGKRRKYDLDASRRSEITNSQESTLSSQEASPDSSVVPSTASIPSLSSTLNESTRFSSLMKDINLLRNEVKDLKKDISLLHHQKQSTSVPSTCHIKVSFPHHAPPLPPDPDLVKSLLGCPVLCVSRVGPTSLKVKIPKECLHNAITSSRSNSHMVHVWKNRISRPNSSSHPPQTPLQFSSIESISIASWNCRGLHNSIPYILELLSRDVHILILQEHWLWPFQLDQL